MRTIIDYLMEARKGEFATIVSEDFNEMVKQIVTSLAERAGVKVVYSTFTGAWHQGPGFLRPGPISPKEQTVNHKGMQ